MNCLRCGYCCLTYAIVIVNDPDKGVEEDNLKVLDGSERCPHLVGDKPGEYSCAIHDKEWYEETPCFQHGQIERCNTNCRMGQHILKKDGE